MVSFLLLFGDITVIVEVAEEDDEGDAVTEHERVHGIWEVTLCQKVVTRVQQEHHKLHLEGEMLRQIILHRLAAHAHTLCGQEVLTSCRDVRYFFHHRYFCM